MTPDDTKPIYLSKDQFCKETGIDKDCWIFNDMSDNQQLIRFWKYVYTNKAENPDTYCFDNGKGKIMAFKYMHEYDETWIKILWDDNDPKSSQSLWSTWKVW